MQSAVEQCVFSAANLRAQCICHGLCADDRAARDRAMADRHHQTIMELFVRGVAPLSDVTRGLTALLSLATGSKARRIRLLKADVLGVLADVLTWADSRAPVVGDRVDVTKEDDSRTGQCGHVLSVEDARGRVGVCFSDGVTQRFEPTSVRLASTVDPATAEGHTMLMTALKLVVAVKGDWVGNRVTVRGGLTVHADWGSVVPSLVALLDHTRYGPLLTRMAAEAIVPFTATKVNVPRVLDAALVTLPVARALVALLTSTADPATRRSVTTTLRNLTCSPDGRASVVNKGGVEALVGLLVPPLPSSPQGLDVSVTKDAAVALSHIGAISGPGAGRTACVARLVATPGAVRYLVQELLVKDKTNNTARHVCSLLGMMAVDPEGARVVRSVDGVPALLRLIAVEDEVVSLAAIRGVRAMFDGSGRNAVRRATVLLAVAQNPGCIPRCVMPSQPGLALHYLMEGLRQAAEEGLREALLANPVATEEDTFRWGAWITAARAVGLASARMHDVLHLRVPAMKEFKRKKVEHRRTLVSRLDEEQTKSPPPDFFCPITHQIMVDPMCGSDGHTYDAKALATYLRDTVAPPSPMTREAMQPGFQVPNRALRQLIVDFATHKGAQRPRCPLTTQVIRDPVLASDGNTYEREALEAAMLEQGHRSPVDGHVLSSTVVPNITLLKVLADEAEDAPPRKKPRLDAHVQLTVGGGEDGRGGQCVRMSMRLP